MGLNDQQDLQQAFQARCSRHFGNQVMERQLKYEGRTTDARHAEQLTLEKEIAPTERTVEQTVTATKLEKQTEEQMTQPIIEMSTAADSMVDAELQEQIPVAQRLVPNTVEVPQRGSHRPGVEVRKQ